MIVQMALLSCCVEKQGYYDSGEESIIALICDITWTGGKKEYEDGSSWESIWNFDKDGTYIRTNVLKEVVFLGELRIGVAAENLDVLSVRNHQ